MTRARLLTLTGAIGISLLTACGGGDNAVQPGTPDKTCQQDPTQAKCVTTPPPASTLRSLSTARGRSMGVAADAAFFGTNPGQYDTVVAREFNMIVAGNVMKWSSIHRDSRYAYRWTNPDAMVAFAQANRMKVRGHTLAWHQQNPAWLTNTTWNAETLKVVLKEHIDSVVGHYKGRVVAWDVVNEAINDGTGTLRTTGSPWATTIGRDYIDLAFREARAADPSAQLFYNDYNLEFPGAKQDSAFAMIAGMKARGVPIDGIGFQGHFQINADGTGVPSQESLVSTFSRFAALGLKVHITELDIRVRTPGATAAELAAQSQGFSTVVSACLAVAACEAIVVWGLNDGESWIPGAFPGYGQALLFDERLREEGDLQRREDGAGRVRFLISCGSGSFPTGTIVAAESSALDRSLLLRSPRRTTALTENGMPQKDTPEKPRKPRARKTPAKKSAPVPAEIADAPVEKSVELGDGYVANPDTSLESGSREGRARADDLHEAMHQRRDESPGEVF